MLGRRKPGGTERLASHCAASLLAKLLVKVKGNLMAQHSTLGSKMVLAFLLRVMVWAQAPCHFECSDC